MKKFNICIIQPENYIHSYAFLELGELLYYSLRELGLYVTMDFNKVEYGCRNIIIGCHLLDLSLASQIPESSIILNTEQVYSDTTHWNKNIFEWAEKFEVWDYSERNIEKFIELGVKKIKLLKIGFQKELARISESKVKDVDVLFYGSINERRQFILDGLLKKGLSVKVLFGVYGKERDDWVARSKIVLNHHFYNSQIFEIVRVFYLMSNSIAVVGEVNESTSIDLMCKDGVYATKYDDLVSSCVEVVDDINLQKRIKLSALASISRYPQKLFTQEVL